MAHRVGEVARMAGVTVRTLHHYDDIGLLRPSGRSDAGYRLYEHGDLERLQELLFYRELGLGLEEIRRIVEDVEYDRTAALGEHRRLLIERRDRVSALIDAVEKALEARVRGITMNAEDMLEIFGDFDPAQYEHEVQERWGGTPAFEESRRKTANYTKEDWLRIKEETGVNLERFVSLLRAGAAPTDEEAMDAAEEHRSHIGRFFYDCSYEIHRGLGEMYLQDARFTKFYEDVEPGLARFVSEAIVANAQRNA